MRTFEHGGDIKAFVKAYGCKADEVIDLSSNINFVRPNIDIDFNSLEIASYPNYDALYEAVAKHNNVGIEEIELFNGGTSAIFSLFRLLKERHQHCTIYAPAYLEYKKATTVFGYETVHINRYKNLDQEQIKESLIVFVNPSTPDGIYYDIETMLDKWISKNCTILIDESFLEFTNKPSLSYHIKNHNRLYILKSMTKFYGAAGIRIGALLSNKHNITALKSYEPNWKLSALDSYYIQEVLKDQTLKRRTDTALTKNKTLLVSLLQKCPFVEKIYPTEANYLLLKLKNINATAFQDILSKEKILIRNCANFEGLDDSYVRIAIKDEASVAALQRSLDA